MDALKKQLIARALECRSLGIIPIPTSEKKRAVAKWREYTEHPPSEQETIRTFNFSFTMGIALLCGPVSGDLEVIDIDCKNDINGHLMRRYYDLLVAQNRELAVKLPIQRTRSGGYHLLYRCQGVERSQPLARRPATDEELAKDPDQKVKVLIETRGTKGMACISPSEGYSFIRGNIFAIPLITAEERDILLTAARTFNQVKEREKVKRITRFVDIDPATSPIDDYNKRGDIISLLEKHGWHIVDEEPERTIFRRPGDTDKDSSGNFNHRLNLFSTFSTSTEFIAEKGYTPASVYILLEHKGNRSEATKELLRMGYGLSYKEQRQLQQATRMKWKC